jgi:hypothetical protein
MAVTVQLRSGAQTQYGFQPILLRSAFLYFAFDKFQPERFWFESIPVHHIGKLRFFEAFFIFTSAEARYPPTLWSLHQGKRAYLHSQTRNIGVLIYGQSHCNIL